jgi:similarity
VKQFLIREFKDDTGNVYVDVEQPRENECMTLVEAEDKEAAKEKAKRILSQHDRLQLRKLYRLQERLG